MPYQSSCAADKDRAVDRLYAEACVPDRGEWLASLGNASCGTLVADCSPSYLKYADLPGVLAELYGEADRARLVFLVLVRDPIDRARSAFWYGVAQVGHGRDTGIAGASFRSFAVRSEPGERSRMRCRPKESKALCPGSFPGLLRAADRLAESGLTADVVWLGTRLNNLFNFAKL